MPPRKTQTTCTVDAHAFVSLLDDTLRSACTDESLPMIAGVLLHTDKHRDTGVLVATSTDRFCAIQAHVACTGGIPQVFLSATNAKRALTVFKAVLPRAKALQLEIARLADTLVLAVPGTVLTFPATDGHDFPAIGHVLNAPKEPEATDRVMLNPRYLARFAAIAHAHRAEMQIRVYGQTKPVHILIGDTVRGLAMPVRTPEGADTSSPVFAIPSEQAKKPRTVKPAAKTPAKPTLKPAAKTPPKTPAKPAARRATTKRAA